MRGFLGGIFGWFYHYHRIAFLWRTFLHFCGAPAGLLGAPQNRRHKNIFCGAPSLVRHIILTFLWRT